MPECHKLANPLRLGYHHAIRVILSPKKVRFPELICYLAILQGIVKVLAKCQKVHSISSLDAKVLHFPRIHVLHNLKTLNTHNVCQASADFVARKCPNVTDLQLQCDWRHPHQVSIEAILERCLSLTALNLVIFDLPTSDFAKFAYLRNLRHLYFYSGDMTDDVCRTLSVALNKSLEELKLSGLGKGSFTINVRGHFDFQDFFNPPPSPHGNVRKKMSTPQLMSAN